MADRIELKSDSAADEGDRWTVRGVSREARTRAKSMADAGRQSVGEWLTAVIMAAANGQTWTADMADGERQTTADEARRTAADETSRGRQTDGRQVADIERLVSAAAQLAGAPEVPKAVRSTLNRAIRDQGKHLLPLALPAPGRQSV
jgi:hypothetical protein